MSTINNAVLPVGSTILVTGANSYLATHVIDQLLKLGYKVRGSVRDVSKNSWLIPLFSKYGDGAIELVEVKDISIEGAFDEAAKGSSSLSTHCTRLIF